MTLYLRAARNYCFILVTMWGVLCQTSFGYDAPWKTINYSIEGPRLNGNYFDFKIDFQVQNPVTGTWHPGSTGWFTVNQAGNPTVYVNDGIISWVAKSIVNRLDYLVGYATYDVARNSWKLAVHNCHSKWETPPPAPTIKDGVMTFARLTGHNYASEWTLHAYTYDVTIGTWRGKEVLQSGRTPHAILCKDGVVAWILGPYYSEVDRLYMAYDLVLRDWQSNLTRLIYPQGTPTQSSSISHATVEYRNTPQSASLLSGYFHSTQSWHHQTNPDSAGPRTEPYSLFYPSTFSGEWPLGVWFIDMSLGGSFGSPSSYRWTFGDGNTSASQSPYHVYGVPGAYTVQQTVYRPGQTSQDNHSSSRVVTVHKAGTALSVTPVSGVINFPVQLTATIRRTHNSDLVLSGRVQFLINGTVVGESNCVNGVASYTYTIPTGPGAGSRTITARYLGDSLYNPSEGSSNLTVSRATTRLQSPNIDASPGETVTLYATLKRELDGKMMSSQPVSFSALSYNSGALPTNQEGFRSTDFLVPSNTQLGNYTIQVVFPGSIDLEPASTTGTLRVAQSSTGTRLKHVLFSPSGAAMDTHISSLPTLFEFSLGEYAVANLMGNNSNRPGDFYTGPNADLWAGFWRTFARTNALISRFDSGPEGWKVSGGPGSNEVDPQWDSANGLPPGSIRTVDVFPNTLFSAPAPFLGNKSDYYRKTLAYDIYIRYTDDVYYPAVVLRGANLTVSYKLPYLLPVNQWTRVVIPLSEAGWRVNHSEGPLATQQQFVEVISNLQALYILAEWRSGPNDTNIDNVVFGGVEGDTNGDGCVDDADLLIVLFNFSGSGQGDLNHDGIVDDADLLIVLFNFGNGC